MPCLCGWKSLRVLCLFVCLYVCVCETERDRESECLRVCDGGGGVWRGVLNPSAADDDDYYHYFVDEDIYDTGDVMK